MPLFRIPLALNKRNNFFKLFGSGKNGTFDIVPDLKQWGAMVILNSDISTQLSSDEVRVHAFGKFITNWYRFFQAKHFTVILEPIEGWGLWDGREVFGSLPRNTDYAGVIAVLTRATISIKRLRSFWRHVDYAAAPLFSSPGYITSFGIGEIPWIKQATFSIWESKELMKQYAYQMQQHRHIIQKTKTENWHAEEMFIRFKILAAYGDHPAITKVKPHLA